MVGWVGGCWDASAGLVACLVGPNNSETTFLISISIVTPISGSLP